MAGLFPLDHYGSHWKEGTANGVTQEALMDPRHPRGTQQLPTELDLAGLQDICWQVVSEPSTIILLLIGMAIPSLRRDRRSFV